MYRKALITGGCGFIGSHLIRHLLNGASYRVMNIDSLSYAGNLATSADFEDNTDYQFTKVDIRDFAKVKNVINQFQPDIIFHLAAESHVDRSIDDPLAFMETNILGTFNLLEASRDYYFSRDEIFQEKFRFVNVSTDEVFGSLGADGFFDESTAYDPRSPYSASKASADHLCRAWFHTFGLPILITNCSNNYGPYQYPEKLIPVVINKVLNNEPIPVYGDGNNIRDWLYVSDHAAAIHLVGEKGIAGETYVIGTNCEKTTLDIVTTICELLDERLVRNSAGSSSNLIQYVTDRPGHDRRYAIDASKIRTDLGWVPLKTYEDAMAETVEWYLLNQRWCNEVTGSQETLNRIGLGK